MGPYILDERLIKHNIKVLNGIHDSDAAYSLFLKSKIKKFNLLSSGTHFVIMNPYVSTNCLIESKDMYCGLDIYGKKVPTIRFMGGREYEYLIKKFKLKNFKKCFYENFFDNNKYIYPSFGLGGPFHNLKGNLNNVNFKSKKEKYMSVVTYIAFMTNYCLELIKSKDDIIITGPLINNFEILQILAALRYKTKIYLYTGQEATSVGCNLINQKNYKLDLKVVRYKKNLKIQQAFKYWLKTIGYLNN